MMAVRSPDDTPGVAAERADVMVDRVNQKAVRPASTGDAPMRSRFPRRTYLLAARGRTGSQALGLVTSSSAATTTPTTSVLIPASGAKLAGTATLDASASNATSVEFWIVGGSYGYGKMIGLATSSPYGWYFSWNSMTVPNGSYILLSEAFNASTSSFSKGVSITVSNPTTTSVIIPSTGANLSNTAALDASAGNATSVEFLLSGGSYGSSPGQVIGTATPTYYGWLYRWNTMTAPNGSYALVSEAFNGGGSVVSSPVSITIDNAPYWSQFRFGPNLGGYNSNETAISVSNVSSLVQLFSARAGRNSDSSPAIVNGVLYEGADDHMLYAYDAAGDTDCNGTPKTCAPLWSATSGGFRFSSPAGRTALSTRAPTTASSTRTTPGASPTARARRRYALHSGRQTQVRESNHLRPSRMESSISAPATAICTRSMHREIRTAQALRRHARRSGSGIPGAASCLVCGRGERRRLHRFTQRQSLCLRRSRNDELLGHAEGLFPAMDCCNRKSDLVLAGRGRRRRLRRV